MGLRFFAVACSTPDALTAALQAADQAHAHNPAAEHDDCLQLHQFEDLGITTIRPIERGLPTMNALWDLIQTGRGDIEDLSFHSVSMSKDEMHRWTQPLIDRVEAGDVGDLRRWPPTKHSANQTGDE